jgi:hypothetical protein
LTCCTTYKRVEKMMTNNKVTVHALFLITPSPAGSWGKG